LRVVATVVVALAAWAILGYFATLPLGAIYGWAGHPAIPAAPTAVYVGLYLGVLPVLCAAGSWMLVRWVEARLRGRR